MGIFGKIKGAVGKVFGSKPAPVFQSHKRKEEDAVVATDSQAVRRRRQLEERVKKGESAQVYPNKKRINPISNDVPTSGAVGSPSDVDIGESIYFEAFLDGYELGRFASSNVYRIVYDRLKNHLYVQFMGGKGKRRAGPGNWYQYRSVSQLEAREVYNTASKGVWVWSNLRQRGSQYWSKKPFSKGVKPPSYLPLKATSKWEKQK